jgi:branched-chain amino acid transport system substrate-binding protein
MNRLPARLLLMALGIVALSLPAVAQTAGGKRAHPSTAARTAKPYYANTPADLIPYRRMVKPYHDNFYVEPQPWRGIGRNDPEPKVQTVRLGWLGPLADTDPLAPFGRSMLHGAQLAVERANAGGGYKGHPFELMIHQDKARWGDSSNSMVKMVCDDQVWGVLGTVDSANAHVMMRVTLKFPVPVINCATSDQGLMEHRVPFITRNLPDDRQYSYATALYLFQEKGYRSVALFRLNNRDGRFAVKKLTDAARRLGHPFVLDQRFEDGETDFTSELTRIRARNPDAVAVWGNPREVSLIVRQMRRMGMKQPVVGWFRSVSPALLSMGGRDVEGMVCAFPYNPSAADPVLQEFRRRYRKRFDEEPDVFAAYAYDGINLFVHAIRQAGLNRIRIAEALAALKTYRGVTGTALFDGARNNIAPIYLAEVRGGRFAFRLARRAREGYRQAALPPSVGTRGARTSPASSAPRWTRAARE